MSVMTAQSPEKGPKPSAFQKTLKTSLGAEDDVFTREEDTEVKINYSQSSNLNPTNYRSYSAFRKNTNYERGNIVRICLTGGPCAGKTTAIASIKQDLAQLGL